MFGVDAVRYFVLHEMPFDNDGAITWELLTERINSDLANTLGNLVKRTVDMSNKYFGGVVARTGETGPEDAALEAAATGAAGRVCALMDALRVADALTEIFALFKRCNKYIDETTPWLLARDEAKRGRLAEVLYHLVESISIGAALLEPFLPETAARIRAQLGGGARPLASLSAFGGHPSGARVAEKSEVLFARHDLKAVLEAAAAIAARQQADAGHTGAAQADAQPAGDGNAAGAQPAAGGQAAGEPPLPEIEYEDFAKLDLRLARVVACEEVKRSKKLLKLTLDVGGEQRTVVSGIKAWYAPDALVGKTVVLVANLKPVTLCGVESRGMILCASDAGDEHLSALTTLSEMESGLKVR